MNLPKAIQQLRKEKSLTQTQLIERCELGHNQLTRIEKGYSTPTIETLQRICSELGVKLSELIIKAENLN